MKPFPYIPGVPAAGHISRGFWHPGAIDGCGKCDTPKTGGRFHNDRVREQGRCDCPCHRGQPDLCDCRGRR